MTTDPTATRPSDDAALIAEAKQWSAATSDDERRAVIERLLTALFGEGTPIRTWSGREAGLVGRLLSCAARLREVGAERDKYREEAAASWLRVDELSLRLADLYAEHVAS